MKQNFYLLFLISFLAVFTNTYSQSWEKTFLPENTYAEGFDVKPTSDGGFIVVGEVDWPTGAIRHYIHLIKTDAQGNEEWSQVYHAGDILLEEGRSVMQTTDDGFLVGGTKGYTIGTDDMDLYLMKTDAMGDTLWTQIYNEPGAQNGRSLIATSDGGYLLVGLNNPGLVMVKTDALGNLSWKRTYSAMDGAADVIQVADGGYVLTGGHQALTFLMKTDINGDSLWMDTYISSKYSSGSSLLETADGGFVVGSYSSGFAGINPVIFKTDADGNEDWISSFILNGLQFWGQVNDIDLTNNGDFVITGFTAGLPQPPLAEGYIVRLNDQGEGEWGTLISDTLVANGNAVVALDNNCYILTGRSQQGTVLAKICEADNPTSTKEAGVSTAIQVYPNPANGNIAVVLNDEIVGTNLIFRVFDVVGHQVMEQRLMADDSLINLVECPSGMYLYQISQNGKVIQQDKLVIGH